MIAADRNDSKLNCIEMAKELAKETNKIINDKKIFSKSNKLIYGVPLKETAVKAFSDARYANGIHVVNRQTARERINNENESIKELWDLESQAMIIPSALNINENTTKWFIDYTSKIGITKVRMAHWHDGDIARYKKYLESPEKQKAPKKEAINPFVFVGKPEEQLKDKAQKNVDKYMEKIHSQNPVQLTEGAIELLKKLKENSINSAKEDSLKEKTDKKSENKSSKTDKKSE